MAKTDLQALRAKSSAKITKPNLAPTQFNSGSTAFSAQNNSSVYGAFGNYTQGNNSQVVQNGLPNVSTFANNFSIPSFQNTNQAVAENFNSLQNQQTFQYNSAEHPPIPVASSFPTFSPAPLPPQIPEQFVQNSSDLHPPIPIQNIPIQNFAQPVEGNFNSPQNNQIFPDPSKSSIQNQPQNNFQTQAVVGNFNSPQNFAQNTVLPNTPNSQIAQNAQALYQNYQPQNNPQTFPDLSKSSIQNQPQNLPPQVLKPNPNQAPKNAKVVKKESALDSAINWLLGAPTDTGPSGGKFKVKNEDDIEYLKQLDSAGLKREVIKTEAEIQRTLIDSEKAFRKGMSTVRDLVSPSSVNITAGYINMGTKFVRSFFVLTYPRIISSGWLEGIVNADIQFDLSLMIYPRDSGEVLKELKGKVGKIGASLQLNNEKGAARDPALETAYRDVEGLRDAIQQGVEKFFRVGVYITLYGDSLEDLEKASQVVESVLSQQNIIMKRAALQMDDGFNSCLPILKDDLDVVTNMNTAPLSACFPFVSSDLSSDTGILYGINRHNSSLVIFDRFEMENANALVFATSGAGKSYAVKLEILRSLMMGVNVIVIDPEQEYKVLADTLGGAYINFSLNSPNRINPFDLPKPLPDENTADVLRSGVIDLMGLMGLMLGKLTPGEASIMEKAIMETYSKRDITPQSDFGSAVMPTMQDLVEILQGIVGGEDLAQRLYRYTEGTFSGIFNQRTNINIKNDFIVFNIRDLQEQLRPIAMYILLKYVWNEIRSALKRRILAVDEAWIMMQYEDSARFLFGLVKRARKYYLGVTTITQDVNDFMNSEFGKPIVTNASMKLLLKQSTAAIDLIGQTFALTEGEKQVLVNSEVGQGIFFAGSRHVALQILAFPTEHKIITTNPKDILTMQGLE